MDSMKVQQLREAGLLVKHEMYQCDHVMTVWKDEENPYFHKGGVYVCEMAPSGVLGITCSDGFVFTTTCSEFSPLLEEPEKVEGVTLGISDGGSSSYYDFPNGFSTLADLIDFKDMNFNIGNIFKAAYRLGRKKGVDRRYDLNKIIYFAQRELDKLL